MTEIPSRELRNDTAAVLGRVEEGESLTITTNGRPVARLVPLPRTGRRGMPRAELVRLVREAQADSELRDDLREPGVHALQRGSCVLGLGTSDEILVYQQVVGLVEDPAMNQVALVNTEERFGQVADDKLDDIVAENAERNTDFMKLSFDNEKFQKAVKEAARKRAYKIIREPAREEALAKLRAEMRREAAGGAAR